MSAATLSNASAAMIMALIVNVASPKMKSSFCQGLRVGCQVLGQSIR
jgi:hypothetical protein